MPSSLLWTWSSYFVLYFFKYDAVIIKNPSVTLLIKSCKIFGNKKSPLSSPHHEFGKMLVVFGD